MYIIHQIRDAVKKGDWVNILKLSDQLKTHKPFFQDLTSKIVSASAGSGFVFILSQLINMGWKS
jgi:exoribonuclease II